LSHLSEFAHVLISLVELKLYIFVKFHSIVMLVAFILSVIDFVLMVLNCYTLILPSTGLLSS